MPEELARETDPRAVMYDEVGDTERYSVAQGLLPGIGGAKEGLRAADVENTEVLLV